MSKFKKVITTVAILVIMTSIVLSTSVCAASTPWGNGFSQIQQGTSSSYNYAVQAFLYRYNESLHAIIENSGGVDGDFGNGTRYCVVAYQAENDLEADGIVGWRTWDSMYNHLAYYYYSDYKTYYRVDNGASSYTQRAVSRYYFPTSGGIVKGWYAYDEDNTGIFFTSY